MSCDDSRDAELIDRRDGDKLIARALSLVKRRHGGYMLRTEGSASMA